MARILRVEGQDSEDLCCLKSELHKLQIPPLLNWVNMEHKTHTMNSEVCFGLKEITARLSWRNTVSSQTPSAINKAPGLVSLRDVQLFWTLQLCRWHDVRFNSPCSGSSPYAFKLRASSALYLRMTSALLSWNGRRWSVRHWRYDGHALFIV